MECPTWESSLQVYDLGKISRPRYPGDLKYEGNVFVFYERKIGQSSQNDVGVDELYVETVGFDHQDTNRIIDERWQIIFSSHPNLRQRMPYLDIKLRTKKNGTLERVMISPPVLNGKERFLEVKLDMSEWDLEIRKRLLSLPDHVKKVYGI